MTLKDMKVKESGRAVSIGVECALRRRLLDAV